MLASADRGGRFLERELRRHVHSDVTPGPGGLLGLELEFSVRSGVLGRVHFGSLIHRLALDGSTLDPGDPNAYRCGWGGVITSDGAEAEIATPPVPTRPGFTSEIWSWAETGEAELRHVVPAGIELTGYSAHFSAAMPARLNEPVCRLYAETFAVGLMLLMERADSPGLLIRPRPGRTELCGEFVAGEPLPAVAAFVAGSTRACAAAVRKRSARKLLPPGLEVRLAPAVHRYGWYVDRAAFGTDLHAASRRTILSRASGGTISAQSHLELAWAAARQVLAEDAADADLQAADAMVAGSLPLPAEHRPPGGPAHRQPRDGDRLRPGDQVPRHTPPRLGVRARPGFSLCPVAATWDFMVFEANGPGRTAYVCVPRDSLLGFVDRLESGALDDIIAGYLALRARRQVLSSHRQTGHLGLYDRISAPAPLLAPERDPQTGRRDSARQLAKYAFTRPGKSPRREDPDIRAGPRFVRRALIVVTVLATLLAGAGAAAAAFSHGRSHARTQPSASPSSQPSTPFPSVTLNSTTTGQPTMTDTSAGGRLTTPPSSHQASVSVTGILPPSGPLSGGTTVRITGSGFAKGATVDFGSVQAASVYVSDTEITAVSPPSPTLGAVTVKVTLDGLTSAATTADLFTYRPWITGIVAVYEVAGLNRRVSPAKGPVSGGTRVTITGSGFAKGATVDFGSVQAASMYVVSDTEITAVTPHGSTLGTVTVTVTVGGVTSAVTPVSQFTYETLAVSDVSPAIGPASGGMLVTITGSGFADGATVDFGSVQAASVGVVSDTEIIAVSPPSPTAGADTVKVTVGGLTSAATPADQFTYQPVVSSISPAIGSASGGTTVTITGSGFGGGATAVYFGSNSAVITFMSSSKIIVVSPPRTAGDMVAITVTVGTVRAVHATADLFTYL